MTYFNADGEPLMTAAEARFEAGLDAEASYDYMLDTEYGIDFDDRPDIDPADCDHGDYNGNGNRTVECIWCETKGLVVVENFVDYHFDEEIEKVIVWSA